MSNAATSSIKLGLTIALLEGSELIYCQSVKKQ